MRDLPGGVWTLVAGVVVTLATVLLGSRLFGSGLVGLIPAILLTQIWVTRRARRRRGE